VTIRSSIRPLHGSPAILPTVNAPATAVDEQPDHPVEVLRRLALDLLAPHLPRGSALAWQSCAEPQMFPGASGTLDVDDWAEVDPGSSRLVRLGPPPVRGGVIVVGNFQASAASYRRILSQEIGGLRVFWGHLRNLMAATDPREVFLTNAYPAFPDTDSDTGRFPSTPEFDRACGAFLQETIRLLAPRAVVCLGQWAPTMLARISPQVRAAWNPWSSFASLDATNQRTVRGCGLSGSPGDGPTFTAVSVHHPSSRVSRAVRADDARLVGTATRMRPSEGVRTLIAGEDHLLCQPGQPLWAGSARR
jgi:uracil-DNA glycosylase